MEADIDSPNSGSPLSDMDSDDFPEDVKFNDPPRSRASTISASDDDLASHSSVTASRVFDMPPAKRRKTGLSSYDHATPQSGSTAAGGRSRSRSPTGSISSDSSGSVPTSPSHANLGPTHPLSTAYAAAQANPENPEMADYVQVTRCLWDGCTDREQGNMDNLVTHINDVHIVPRQKKYYCEWEGCPRKGQPHTSAYALKAHMRSHTKEKPFMCSLPECDRSFTRSDALAKHMRTVHETEALRPSDPVPRGHTGGISNGGPTSNTIKRLKLTMGGKANGDKKAALMGDLPELPTRYTVAMMGINPDDVEMADPDASDELADAVDVDSVPSTLPLPADYWPAEIWEGMDEYERSLPPSQYFRLLRRQICWAEEEGRELQRELEDLRSRFEDSQGNIIKRGAGDEKGADENRRLEWQQVEELLDTILRAECAKVFESLGAEKPPGVEEMDPWDLLKSLPRTLPQLTANDN
ncbi:hypothetical protein HRR83_009222 [Exophiala dermatitidis]|uniref:Zinc finger protein GLI n=2 Tax=Exophiala dermatitidis TaxID=5970 RepID=H6BUU6_EXODN|nr:zinc finger protein GLI [Exophiala dermatitidis NIH/UT8656]KAJ4502215.1 hypothetical protein HRR75_008544 [Exophiala dermatitidis]EHY55783.1 zinc finger protein GLI [Exophiala dermatitidis NIH/UT8656]KAJ4502963.1 hypothetical protein HRR73_009237 [Exophiala dermatitidis]KAJ4503386.1 hypothetical protein HRR74_009293 [Exophiala dermatitidis]KAJ4535406.1 hypothetical protein HRR77_008021 [Exophiala dermatitidis]